MKFDSPFFDRIRVKPGEDRRPKTDCPACEWPGCEAQGTHRAPKGRGHENQYRRFCLEHVREYNHGYNYFSGMSDDAVADYQKDALTGHRPTWKMGMVGGKRSAKPSYTRFDRTVSDGADDPFGLFRDIGQGGAKPESKAEAEARSVRNAERKALQVLGLEPGAKKAEIRARFHELVKRHHPDHNDGDRSMEDRLVEVIQSYNYLKSTGLC